MLPLGGRFLPRASFQLNSTYLCISIRARPELSYPMLILNPSQRLDCPHPVSRYDSENSRTHVVNSPVK
jgi:hypothetical protein